MEGYNVSKIIEYKWRGSRGGENHSSKEGNYRKFSMPCSNIPENFCETIQAPAINIAKVLLGKFDYIHIFVISRFKLEESMKMLKPYLEEQGIFGFLARNRRSKIRTLI